MLVVPGPTTAFVDPFTSATIRVLTCDVRDPATVSPTADPLHRLEGRPDHELLLAAGAHSLRSSDQSGLLPTRPLGLLPDSNVSVEPAGETRRVPFTGVLVQSLPGLRRDAGLDSIKNLYDLLPPKRRR